MIRSYKELVKLKTFKERFDYLKLDGKVGKEIFGFERIFNQKFYNSVEWKRIRNEIIVRDNGCDLGVEGYEIRGHRIIIHHLNPITLYDLEYRSDFLMNPDYLITTVHSTHNAIHYGNDGSFVETVSLINRSPNDTCPWKSK
jgi:hypothetical protein